MSRSFKKDALARLGKDQMRASSKSLPLASGPRQLRNLNMVGLAIELMKAGKLSVRNINERFGLQLVSVEELEAMAKVRKLCMSSVYGRLGN